MKAIKASIKTHFHKTKFVFICFHLNSYLHSKQKYKSCYAVIKYAYRFEYFIAAFPDILQLMNDSLLFNFLLFVNLVIALIAAALYIQ